MATLEEVPIIEVNKDNLAQIWPGLMLAIKSATFIAVDTELSGLGNRKLLNAKIMDERYHHMCEVARTRSIVAFGISCFKLIPPQKSEPEPASDEGKQKRKKTIHHFQVQTYNILLLCADNYVVEPHSLQFLVAHGFDFNQQYSKGVPYKRGMDKEKESEMPSPYNIREIFSQILLSQAPFVLHNALVDLVFLYHSLYTALPTSQQTFVSDLTSMFPAGLFDTKYVTDFKARLDASYLEYVFKRSQRGNNESSNKGWSHIEVAFPQYPLTDFISNMPCTSNAGLHKDITEDKICNQYRHHGWCPDGETCRLIHNIDVILDFEDGPRAKKSAQNGSDEADMEVADAQNDNSAAEMAVESEPSSQTAESPMVTEAAPSGNGPSESVNKAGSHRAGFDAFMTGYIFAFFSARYGRKNVEITEKSLKGDELGMDDFKNKIYLVGKDIPLQITTSSFSKPSKGHKTKMQKLKAAKTE